MSYEKFDKFWFVWGEGKQPPAHKHLTYDLAMEEAHRLSVKHPGETFYVGEAMNAMTKVPKRKVWTWRYRSADKPQWRVAKRLMDYAEAFELFIGHEFEPHAGPFEVHS